jgi:hypothetical protein
MMMNSSMVQGIQTAAFVAMQVRMQLASQGFVALGRAKIERASRHQFKRQIHK